MDDDSIYSDNIASRDKNILSFCFLGVYIFCKILAKCIFNGHFVLLLMCVDGASNTNTWKN